VPTLACRTCCIYYSLNGMDQIIFSQMPGFSTIIANTHMSFPFPISSPRPLLCANNSCATRARSGGAKNRTCSRSFSSRSRSSPSLSSKSMCYKTSNIPPNVPVVYCFYTNSIHARKFRTKVCRAPFGSPKSHKHARRQIRVRHINNKGQKGRGVHLCACHANYQG